MAARAILAGLAAVWIADRADSPLRAADLASTPIADETARQRDAVSAAQRPEMYTVDV